MISLPKWGIGECLPGESGSRRRRQFIPVPWFSPAARNQRSHAGARVRTRRPRQFRGWAAAVALFALVVHTIAAGLADGAMAGGDRLASVSRVICTGHGPQTAPRNSDQRGRDFPRPICCVTGCPVASGHGALSSALTVVPVPPTLLDRLLPRPAAASRVRLAYSPHSARAPPFEFRLIK